MPHGIVYTTADIDGTAPPHEAEAAPEAAKHDFACRSCGRWVCTAPATWARARCANRRCALFAQQQTMYAGRVGADPLRGTDS